VWTKSLLPLLFSELRRLQGDWVESVFAVFLLSSRVPFDLHREADEAKDLPMEMASLPSWLG